MQVRYITSFLLRNKKNGLFIVAPGLTTRGFAPTHSSLQHGYISSTELCSFYTLESVMYNMSDAFYDISMT